jgi:hypothetical protein
MLIPVRAHYGAYFKRQDIQWLAERDASIKVEILLGWRVIGIRPSKILDSRVVLN